MRLAAIRLRAFMVREFQVATSYRFQFLFQVFSSFFIVVMFYFIAQLMGTNAMEQVHERYQTDYFSFVLVGVAGNTMLETATRGFSERLRQTMAEGSLEMMFVTPTPPVTIITLPSIWTFFFDGMKAAIILLLGAVVFGADLQANIGAWLVVAICTGLAYSVFGILSLVFIMVLKRGDPVLWLVGQASAVVGGAYFPIEVLPEWLQALSWALPMTYAYDAMRATLLTNASIFDVGGQLTLLLGFSAIGLPIAIWTCQRAIDRARLDGSLGSF